MVRAKFMLCEQRETAYGYTTAEGYKVHKGEGKLLIFSPQYDTSIEEDKRFSKATPSGRIEMQVDNPAALEQFELGQTYYFDISPAK